MIGDDGWQYLARVKQGNDTMALFLRTTPRQDVSRGIADSFTSSGVGVEREYHRSRK